MTQLNWEGYLGQCQISYNEINTSSGVLTILHTAFPDDYNITRIKESCDDYPGKIIYNRGTND